MNLKAFAITFVLAVVAGASAPADDCGLVGQWSFDEQEGDTLLKSATGGEGLHTDFQKAFEIEMTFATETGEAVSMSLLFSMIKSPEGGGPLVKTTTGVSARSRML